MKISYNLFVYKCFLAYIYYTAKAGLHPGRTVFCYGIEKNAWDREQSARCCSEEMGTAYSE